MTIDPVIVLIVRCGLAWLFLAAVLHKFRDMGDFGAVLASYEVVPERFAGACAWLVVGAEVSIAAGALVQYRPAYAAAAFVLFGYAGAIALNLLRGRRLDDCGCGGMPQPPSVGLVLRNVVLSVGALIALLPAFVRPLGWLDIAGVIAGSAVLGALYAGANHLLAARARLEEWV